MRKNLLSAAFCCCVLTLASCSDDNQVPKPLAGRIAFDAPALAEKLNTDYESFCQENEKNAASVRSAEAGSFRMNGYLKAGADSILMTIRVDKDEYGHIGSINATLDDPDKNLPVWKYYLANAESFCLGQFLGTKFRSPGSSGVHQTVEDTINLIETGGTAGTQTYTLFSVIPGSAYAVAILSEGIFTITLTNSYLTLDYPAMRGWLGGDHAAFASQYYILGNKINLWGNIYVYFDSAKDSDGNSFTVDVHADKAGAVITEIDIYVNKEKNTEAQQLAIWKDYAAHAGDFGLGVFKEAYTTDSGGRKDNFASLGEVMAYVEENGRPGPFDGGIIVVFEADGIDTNLVMNAQYIYLLMKDPNYTVE